MQKRIVKYLSIIFILFTHLSLSAQNQFQFTIGRPHNETSHSIIQLNDGKYIVCGHSLDLGVSDIFVIKFSSNGVIDWSKSINGPWAGLHNFKIIKTIDGGFVISGHTSLSGATSIDIYIVKLDANGNVQWTKQIGSPETDYGRSIIQTSDGGYIVTGYTNTNGSTNNDVLILRLNSAGDYIWGKTLGGSNNDIAYSIISSQDNGYILTGSTTSFGAGGNDFLVVKLDVNGSVLWGKTIGESGNEVAYSVIQTQDNGYVFSGYTNSFNNESDLFTVKLDILGNLIWTRVVGGSLNDYGRSILQTTNNDFIICGETNSFSSTQDVYLVKLNPAGLLITSKVISINGIETSNSIIQTLDGGFITSGSTNSSGAGGLDFLITKFDINLNTCSNLIQPASTSNTGGTLNSISLTSNNANFIVTSPVPTVIAGATLATICTTVGINPIENQVPDKFLLEQNYPNPFNPVTNIQFQIPRNEFILLDIFDLNGKKVETLINQNLEAGSYEVKWNAENYPSGIYFYKLQASYYSETKKMILIK